MSWWLGAVVIACGGVFIDEFEDHTGACYNGSVISVAREVFTDGRRFICEGTSCTCLHGERCSGRAAAGEVVEGDAFITRYEGEGCTGASSTTQYSASGPIGARESGTDYRVGDTTVSYSICAATCINGVVYEVDVINSTTGQGCVRVPRGDLALPYQERGTVVMYAALPGVCHGSFWKVACSGEADEEDNDFSTLEIIGISLAVVVAVATLVYVARVKWGGREPQAYSVEEDL